MAGDGNGIDGQQTTDPIGKVLAGHGRAADVLNVPADLYRITVLATDELGAPVRVAYLPP